MMRRLSLEQLEHRRVLSVSPGTATLTNGVLEICGTDADNQIIVAQTTNGIFVAADFLSTNELFATADVTSVVVTGGDGNDIILALTTANGITLEGEAGDDILFGGSGIDTLRGGDGDDFIYGRGGNDLIFGDAGIDRLLGQDGDDVINGGDGDDFLFGHDGNDTLDGGAGNDSIFGDVGNDGLTGGLGDDLLIGAAGDDVASGNEGIDRIFGVGGNDQLDGGEGGDFIYGGDGDDQVVGNDGDDQVIGGAGIDGVSGGDGDDVVFGGGDADVLIGGSGADTLNGQAGDDVLMAARSDSEGDFTALASAATAWASRADYDAGVQAVQTALSPQSLTDVDTDQLIGSDGQDAFFTNDVDDTVDDQESGESVVGITLTAVADDFTAIQGSTLTVDADNGVLQNDTNDSTDALVVNTIPVSGPLQGTLVLNADGSFAYAHTGDPGTDSFVYEISNGDGTTDQATVSILVATFVASEQLANNSLVGTVQAASSLGSDVVFQFEPDSSTPAALTLAADDHLAGATDGQVVLVEYLDFQCPSCAAFHPIIQALKTEYSEEFLVVTRHLPLETIHPNALEAALYSEAAAAQGQFDAMADLLFAGQSDWSSLADPTAIFDGYVTQLGLNATDVATVIADPATEARIRRDMDAGFNELGAISTPTLFLNGDSVSTGDVGSFDAFSARIDQALADNVSAVTIDALSGEIRVADSSRLDFETQPQISFDVLATGLTTSETIPVVIAVTDATDETSIPVLPGGTVVAALASGLEVADLEAGDGATPIAGDSVRVNYTGYLPNGTIFDSNDDATFSLSGVIDGFAEGIEGMQVGGTRRIIIPPDLGYGVNGNPGAGIAGTDTIVFDVVLREIV